MISPITGGKKKKKTPPDNIRAYCLALDSVFPEVIPVEPSFLSSIFCAKKKNKKQMAQNFHYYWLDWAKAPPAST